MIKDIFIPEAIGSYYLFKQKIVGIELNKDYILVSVVTAKGRKRAINYIYSDIINSPEDLKRILIELKDKIGHFDKVYVSLPTSYAIFKNITLPFIGISKAKMVAPFEIETSLPFTIDQAIVDSIIIDQDTKNKETHLLTAALKKDVINNYINIFNKADIKIDKLGLDIFELYSLYRYLNDKSDNKVVALINLDLSSTTIAIIIDSKMRYIRSLPLGIATGESKEAIDQLLKSGIDSNFDKITSRELHQQKYQELISQIDFTIKTTFKTLNVENSNIKTYITGFGSQIIGMPEFICNTLKYECSLLGIKEIIRNGIQSNINNIPNQYLLSVATALPDPITANFNLLPDQEKNQNNILINQIITLIGLSSIIFIIFLTYSIIKVRKAKKINLNLKNQTIKTLKNTFNLSKPKKLDSVLSGAKDSLKKEKDTLSQILDKNSYSFLSYLDELTRIIDKDRIGLKIDKMTINSNVISIQGSVKDIDAAKLFEHQIEQSPIFSLKTTLQTPEFTKNPMIIEINKNKDK